MNGRLQLLQTAVQAEISNLAPRTKKFDEEWNRERGNLSSLYFPPTYKWAKKTFEHAE